MVEIAVLLSSDCIFRKFVCVLFIKSDMSEPGDNTVKLFQLSRFLLELGLGWRVECCWHLT